MSETDDSLRLTPEQMKAEIKQRGWTNRSLAARWGKSETWISKILNNPERDRVWEDAVRGLPKRKQTNASPRSVTPKS